MKNVIVYTSNTCGFCTAAKEYLAEKGVQYEERNIADKTFRKELMTLGFMSVPVIKIEEEIVLGFDKDRIDSLLSL